MSTTTSNDYLPERIVELARRSLSGETGEGVSDLLAAFGCRELKRRASGWRITSPDQPDGDCEALVLEGLIELLRWNASLEKPRDEYGFATLDGLLKNERWRFALNHVDDAYALASIISRVSALLELKHLQPEYKDLLVTEIEPLALSLLNAWCAPAVPLVHPLTNDVIVRTLFGEAWAYLQDRSSSDSRTTYSASREIRPPFLPGLVPSQVEISVSLPDMGCL